MDAPRTDYQLRQAKFEVKFGFHHFLFLCAGSIPYDKLGIGTSEAKLHCSHSMLTTKTATMEHLFRMLLLSCDDCFFAANNADAGTTAKGFEGMRTKHCGNKQQVKLSLHEAV